MFYVSEGSVVTSINEVGFGGHQASKSSVLSTQGRITPHCIPATSRE